MTPGTPDETRLLGKCREMKEIQIYRDTLHDIDVEYHDYPGLGSNLELDEDYLEKYEHCLEISDLFVWVLRADSRAVSCDLRYYNELRKLAFKRDMPTRLIMNYCDLVQPFNWNKKRNVPSAGQLKTLELMAAFFAGAFKLFPDEKLLYVSSNTKYNFDHLKSGTLESLVLA